MQGPGDPASTSTRGVRTRTRPRRLQDAQGPPSIPPASFTVPPSSSSRKAVATVTGLHEGVRHGCMGGSVVEFSPATREARVRFPAHATLGPLLVPKPHPLGRPSLGFQGCLDVCPAPLLPDPALTARHLAPLNPSPHRSDPEPLTSAPSTPCRGSRAPESLRLSPSPILVPDTSRLVPSLSSGLPTRISRPWRPPGTSPAPQTPDRRTTTHLCHEWPPTVPAHKGLQRSPSGIMPCVFQNHALHPTLIPQPPPPPPPPASFPPQRRHRRHSSHRSPPTHAQTSLAPKSLCSWTVGRTPAR